VVLCSSKEWSVTHQISSFVINVLDSVHKQSFGRHSFPVKISELWQKCSFPVNKHFPEL